MTEVLGWALGDSEETARRRIWSEKRNARQRKIRVEGLEDPRERHGNGKVKSIECEMKKGNADGN